MQFCSVFVASCENELSKRKDGSWGAEVADMCVPVVCAFVGSIDPAPCSQ